MGLWDDVVGPKGYHLYKEHAGSALGIPIPPGGSGLISLADLFALDTDYILELYQPDEAGAPQFVSAVAFPMHPESMQISRDAATQVTPTLGYLPVREHSLNRNVNVRMRGRSGVAARQGHDREGAIITKGGADILKEFDAFLDLYQRVCHDHATFYRTPESAATTAVLGVSSGGPYLVFRSFTNGIHLRVEPVNWTVTKDVQQSRFGYTWFLDLRGYAPADPTNPPRLFGGLQDLFVFVAELIYAAASVVSLAGTAVDRATELANSGRVALQAAATACNTFGNVMSSVNDLTNVPAGYASDLANIVTEAQNAVAGWGDGQQSGVFSGSGASSSRERGPTDDEALEVEGMLATLTRAAIGAATVAGITGGSIGAGSLPLGDEGREAVPAGAIPISDLPTSAFRRRPGPYPVFPWTPDPILAGITVPLPMFGSLETLSKRYYGTARLWRKIANANRMPSAYTMSDGAPLLAGTPLLVPLTSEQLEQARTSPGQDMARDTMGTDLYLDPVSGDLVLVGTATTDIRLSRSTANLEQAIRMRLFATQGSSSPYPGYGLPEMVGTPVTARTVGWIAAQLNQQLIRDPRILELTRVSLIDDGDTVSAVVEVRPILGQLLEVIAPV